MKAVIQIVKSANLCVDEKPFSEIGKGLVVFFCVERGDDDEKLSFFAKKIPNLRLFCDENGKTNLSVKDVCGDVLFVSQFTLAGDCSHGNRPSFSNAEVPDMAKEMYLSCAKMLELEMGKPVKLGEFGADMQITQVNDGPFTILLEK